MLRTLQRFQMVLCAMVATCSFYAPAVNAALLTPRIETGGHLGSIHALATDAVGRYLVSSGSDQSLRIWDSLRGTLLRTLYLSKNAARSGDRGLGALSADGQLLAISSRNKTEPASTALMDKLSLIDWRTGHERFQIEVATGVSRLMFAPVDASPTGQAAGGRLAVLSTSGEVTVYDFNKGGQPSQAACPSPCIDIDFDGSGRLLTLADNGSIRLYDGELKLQAETMLATRPRYARISPDGSRIAMSAAERAQVEVFATSNFRPLYKPELRAMDTSTSMLLAWSGNGTSLYASGAAAASAKPMIRRWTFAGEGGFVDIPVEESAVTAMAALPQEGIVFATARAALKAVAANQKPLWQRQRTLPDFSARESSLQVDQSGSHVRFSIEPATVLSFSAADRVLDKRVPFGIRYAAPIVDDPAWHLTGWPFAPQQSGVALALEKAEVPRCRAISAPRRDDNGTGPSSLFLGTDRALVAYEQSGQQKWRVEVPDSVQLLNVSGDSKLVVAGLADGSLRWYAAADGRALLTLVVDRSGTRWIALTPAGYYESKSGGDELIGWQVSSEGRNTDDFFRASVFRAQRYRPDVVARVLFTRDEDRSLNELDAELGQTTSRTAIERLLPPVVHILEPTDGVPTKSSQVLVRIAVRLPSDPAPVQLRAFVEGRLTQTRGLRVVNPAKTVNGGIEQIYDVTVDVPADDCTVTVIATAGERKSEPALLRVTRSAKPTQQSRRKPTLYVLAIGVGDYRHDNLRLSYPAKDAQDLARTLREQSGRLYERVHSRELLDSSATRDNILAGLSWLREQPTSQDVAVLFLAGHGISDSSEGRYYFLPFDEDLAWPQSTMVEAGQIQSALANTRGRVLLLLDTCHSGNILSSQRGRTALAFSRMVNEMASADSGIVVYAASSGAQASQESARWKNGAFTKAVIEGLRGKADYTASGRVTASALEHYVGERVRDLTQDAQIPTTAKPTTIADFPLALLSTRQVFYRKPWFWAVVGVAAAGVATGIGLGVYARGPDISGLPALRPFTN